MLYRYLAAIELRRAGLMFMGYHDAPIPLGFGHRVRLKLGQGFEWLHVVDVVDVVDLGQTQPACLLSFGPCSVARDAQLEAALYATVQFNGPIIRKYWDQIPDDWKNYEGALRPAEVR